MKQRIPTLLVLVLFIAIISLGYFIVFVNKNNRNNQLKTINPQELIIANITDSSASIVWQTEVPIIGKVAINNTIYPDDRDANGQETKRHTHFVTISNLTPDTNFQFQIEMDNLKYPENPITFKTLSSVLNERALKEQNYSPIRGTILNQNQSPVDEAVVVIKLPNAIPKATFVTTLGNFILPLTRLVTNDLTDTIKITDKQPATIEARKNGLASLVQLSIPIKNQNLAPITLGKNENMIDFLSQPAKTPEPLEFQQQAQRFDLNNDGKINTLDSSLITDLIKRQQYNQSADFNNDKLIDDKDLELIKSALQ